MSTGYRLRPLTARLPDHVWRQLEAVARREGTTVAAVLRRVVLERFGGAEHQPPAGRGVRQ